MKSALKVVAVILFVLALAGLWGNAKFMMKGEGMPSSPAERQGFIVGMFAVPAVLFSGGVLCWAAAARRDRR